MFTEMDTKEAERVVVAKPVASRPTCSNFKSFAELLAGVIDDSPHNSCSETAVAAIRPKTVKFKPMVNHSPSALLSSQAEVPEAAADCDASDKDLKLDTSDMRPTVVYKPQAKLVSKTTVSLLANMGNFDNVQHQTKLSTGDSNQQNDKDKHRLMPQLTSTLHRNPPSRAEAGRTMEPSRLTSQNQEDDHKTLLPVANSDRPSYDGYNWRKYGQKQVKGSEYPRSYYKCTHPNCPVKKKVERSFDGQIAEIVYKGEHNHPKPQPPKRNSGTQGLVACDGTTFQDTSTASLRGSHMNERNEGPESRRETQNEKGVPIRSNFLDKVPGSSDHVGSQPVDNAGVGTSENSLGLSGECNVGSKGLEGDVDEPRNKRSKSENQSNEAGISGEGAQEPRLVVQSSADTEITGDGFRWRKYGQKVVKGNPYPRSYYRCTGLKCNVRKHVERVSDDPTAFITTYEGKHNHDMPGRTTTNPSASAT